MGIPYYFYTIYKKYSNSNNDKSLMIYENDFKNLDIKYLFLDYNSMIHPCAQEVIKLKMDDNLSEIELENLIISKCIIYTDYILKTVNAKWVYIMIDGVAPRAKINQQRERRYKSEIMKNLNECKNIWNSNKITPGTEFMAKLSKKLFEEFVSKNDNVIVSDSNEPGEGEHKMMKLISKLQLNTSDKIFIYGLDADLIMLSLLNTWSKNIILLRDNTFNEKLSDSQKIFTYLDINKLRGCVRNEIEFQLKSHVNDININLDYSNVISDYIFLCILLGNDFLEHVPSLIIKENGLNIILKCYCKCFVKHKKYLTNKIKNENSDDNFTDSIDIVFLKDLFGELSKSEEYFFKNVWSIYKKKDKIYKDVIPLESNDNIIIYSHDYIKYNITGYKQRYYNYYDITNVNESCENYINGLYWVWGYYNSHNHDNWSWYYKFHSSPFISDLYKYLETTWKTTQIIIKLTKPLQPIQQLIMVLPKKSLLEITKEIDIDKYSRFKRLLEQNKFFPDKYTLDMIHKEYMWQSKIFLETIDLNFVNYLLF